MTIRKGKISIVVEWGDHEWTREQDVECTLVETVASLGALWRGVQEAMEEADRVMGWADKDWDADG